MKDYTKECHTWLQDNHAYIYGDVAEYKGQFFTIDRAGSKFYCIDAKGKHYRSSSVKVVAVRWACQEFDNGQPIKTDIITTCTFWNADEAQYYVDALPRYEKVEGNIVEIKEGAGKTYKFRFENGEFKAI